MPQREGPAAVASTRGALPRAAHENVYVVARAHARCVMQEPRTLLIVSGIGKTTRERDESLRAVRDAMTEC